MKNLSPISSNFNVFKITDTIGEAVKLVKTTFSNFNTGNRRFILLFRYFGSTIQLPILQNFTSLLLISLFENINPRKPLILSLSVKIYPQYPSPLLKGSINIFFQSEI